MAGTGERFNPFPGLRPFEAEEHHLFFGREGQSDELLRRLQRTRFLAIVGTSGSGKSSLLRAGLLPALHRGFMAGAGSRWHIALLRPGADPLGNLALALDHTGLWQSEMAAFQSAMLRAMLGRSTLGLLEAVRQAPLPVPDNLLVVVDQFEELFRFKKEAQKAGRGEEAAHFVQLLLEASRQRELPVYVVVTMRSDFLGDCAQFRDLPEASEAEGIAVIERFRRPGRSFLMPPAGETLAPGKLIDISHESLIRNWKRLEKWVEDEARSARIYTRLAEDAKLHLKGQTSLWREPQLGLALQWQEEQKPNSAWARRYNTEFERAIVFLQESDETNHAEIAQREEQRRHQLRRKRLFSAQSVSFGVVLFILAAVSIYSNTQTAAICAEIKEVANYLLPRVIAVSKLNLSISELGKTQSNYIMTNNENNRKEQADAIIRTIDLINRDYDAYDSLRTKSVFQGLYTEEERELFREFDIKWSLYLDLSFEFNRLHQQHRTTAAALLNREMRQAYSEASAALNTLVNINSRDSAKSAKQAEEAYQVALKINTILFGVIALCTIMLVSIWIWFNSV